MAFSMAGGGSPRAQMNVTPLIDVLLVLIIFFMIVVSMDKPKGLEAQVPQKAQPNQPPPPERTIIIQIAWEPRAETPILKINQESVNWNDLQARLQTIYLGRAERVAFIRGADDIDFHYVADVIAVARSSGVDKIGLLGKGE